MSLSRMEYQFSIKVESYKNELDEKENIEKLYGKVRCNFLHSLFKLHFGFKFWLELIQLHKTSP